MFPLGPVAPPPVGALGGKQLHHSPQSLKVRRGHGGSAPTPKRGGWAGLKNPGLFDSRTVFFEKRRKRKKPCVFAELSVLVTRTGPIYPRPEKSPTGAFLPAGTQSGGPGLFDSRTVLFEKSGKKKKPCVFAELSVLVTRTGIEPMLQP